MKRSALKAFVLLFTLCGLALAQQPINLVDVGGSVLGAVSAYGTSPGAVNVIGVNSFVTNTVPVSLGSGAIFEVAPTTSANTKTNPFFSNLTDGTNQLTADLAAWGTTPTGTYVLGVNSELFVGANVVSATAPVPISATAAANTSTNAIFANLTDGTHPLTAAMSAFGTAPTGTYVMGVNADLFINGVLASASASGVQKVGITGNAGAVFDAAGQNVASPANEILVGAQFNTTPTTITSGNISPLQMDSTGHLLVNCTGCSAAATVSLVPEATGGLSAKHFVAAASDNATNVKGSAGQVYSIDGYNNAAYPVYFKLYNASSSPTGCGASNLFKVVGLQAGTQHTLQSEEGWALGTGIGYCLTKGIADSDDTAVLLSDAVIDIGYK
jgi:hypothetical protein